MFYIIYYHNDEVLKYTFAHKQSAIITKYLDDLRIVVSEKFYICKSY